MLGWREMNSARQGWACYGFIFGSQNLIILGTLAARLPFNAQFTVKALIWQISERRQRPLAAVPQPVAAQNALALTGTLQLHAIDWCGIDCAMPPASCSGCRRQRRRRQPHIAKCPHRVCDAVSEHGRAGAPHHCLLIRTTNAHCHAEGTWRALGAPFIIMGSGLLQLAVAAALVTGCALFIAEQSQPALHCLPGPSWRQQAALLADMPADKAARMGPPALSAVTGVAADAMRRVGWSASTKFARFGEDEGVLSGLRPAQPLPACWHRLTPPSALQLAAV